jgi:hypothetical protein
MIFEFQHHDGERWAHLGFAHARGLRRPFDEAFAVLGRVRAEPLPIGLYRVRLTSEAGWHLGELGRDGSFCFDDEILDALERAS